MIKHRLIERYRAKHDLELSSPRIAQIDLAYHDIHRRRGLYYLMQRRGQIERVTSDIEIFEAKSVPPQTTRAKLRGEFVRRAQERRRDFTVDWVHLKLNDQAQRTVLCKDPFASVDERVERLIASMWTRPTCRRGSGSHRAPVMVKPIPRTPMKSKVSAVSLSRTRALSAAVLPLVLLRRLWLRQPARTTSARAAAPPAAAPWTPSPSVPAPRACRPSR